MAGLAHLGVGFAAKRVFPGIPLAVLLIGAYVIDLISTFLLLVGIERFPTAGSMATSPWSHGFFMAVIWSLLAGFITGVISRRLRIGLGMGLVVLSHWVLDFITHPMGAVFGGKPLPPNLPLFFEGSPRVGLGLYNYSFAVVMITEIGFLLAGVGIYILTLRRLKKQKAAGHAAGT